VLMVVRVSGLHGQVPLYPKLTGGVNCRDVNCREICLKKNNEPDPRAYYVFSFFESRCL
jgi:hypothetical protein